jgi:acetyl-CoA carboxylase carboxyl transferase subunit alpha
VPRECFKIVCAGSPFLCELWVKDFSAGRRRFAMKRNRRKEDLEKLEQEVEDLRRLASPEKSSPDLERLRTEVSQLRHEFYDHLGAWQRTLLARHPQRPYMMDYVRILFEDFHELHGDRAYGDDPAMIAGFAKYHGRPVVVIGQQ